MGYVLTGLFSFLAGAIAAAAYLRRKEIKAVFGGGSRTEPGRTEEN